MRDKRQETTSKKAKTSLSVRVANYLIATLLFLVPFHAILTVWGSSIIEGSYTLLRLWTLVVLGAIGLIVARWIIQEKSLRTKLYENVLVRTAALYIVFSLCVVVVGLLSGTVQFKAALLGMFLNTRFVLLFILALATCYKSPWLKNRWKSIVLVPGIIVVVFAVLQYVALPVNFLSHFGYGVDTIPAYHTINSNKEYIRVASTLRGPNPLGAYLVLIISVLAVSLRGYNLLAVLKRSLYLFLAIAALLFSFSRSAWLGVLAAMVVFGLLVATTKKAKLVLLIILVGFSLVSGAVFAIAQNNRAVQNAVFHTDDDSLAKTSSNEDRLSAQSSSVSLALDHPFGMGVGSAGPASIYNQPKAAVITENYFLQLAVEVGWFGLAIFVGLLVYLTAFLWKIRQRSLAKVLLMSLAGLTLVNLLSHAWADETIAFLWWGLAGIAVGTASNSKRKYHHAKAIPNKN